MKRDKKVRPDRTSGVKAESDDYEIEKGSIRLFLAGHQAFANSNRRPHWLAKVVKKLLSHSDILNTHPPTQDREMNREREGERKKERES